MSWKMYDAIVEGTLTLKAKTIDVVNDLLVFNGNTVALLSDSKSSVATYSSEKIESIVVDTYSSSEVITNKSWFGKSVFRKVITTGPVTGAVDNSINMYSHNIVGIESVVSVDFSAKITNSPIWMTSSYSYLIEDPEGEFQQVRTYFDGASVALRTSADLDECFIVLEYTKS